MADALPVATILALPFEHPLRHGFLRIAVAVPRNKVADPVFNAAETVRLLRSAASDGASLVAFPELGLSAYTCDDLFHQRALLDGCEKALLEVAAATLDTPALAVVGLPLRVEHRLFNCAAIVGNGRVLGVVPKTYLPNYGEFYEARQFNSGDTAIAREVLLGGEPVPFGSALVFKASNLANFALHAEICEDVWVPVPPSSFAALAGATVLVNLSASNITIGKSAYRHQLVALQSSRCIAAYVYSSAGVGESTTDMAWDGQALIYESGEMLAQSERFLTESHVIFADVDLERVARDRMRQNSFGDSVARHRGEVERFRSVEFALPLPTAPLGRLRRRLERFPYVPAEAGVRDERCREVYS
ncbi:MAG: NAD(+) synthase, partial [Pseudomonadota bacterium]|nr:NAD(+) synthase [Pseudomonadota bacterium]